ncbi:hypothetical protein [Ktedonobacter robiniae]|nr:hypothetical protein [Ktedonobacter robiniae]
MQQHLLDKRPRFKNHRKNSRFQEVIKNGSLHILNLYWNCIHRIWVYLVVAGIMGGITGNAAYAYVTKGKFDPIDAPNLPAVQLVIKYPLVTVLAVLLFSALTYTSNKAHKRLERVRLAPPQNEYTLRPVSQLKPIDCKLARYVEKAYVLREVDETAHKILQQLSNESLNAYSKMLGICIVGKPAQGKTRLTWEAMQDELPHWTLVHWPHEREHSFDFQALKGKQVILWLDDLHEYAKPNEATSINDLPRRFLEVDAQLIIIATSRDGEDYLLAQKYLGNILEQLTIIQLEDINDAQVIELTKALTKEGVDIRGDEFDGTPGSLVLGVSRMKSRYLNLTEAAKQILKTMKLLRSARIYAYSETRVQSVAGDFFNFDRKDWRLSCALLDREGFLRFRKSAKEELLLEPTADIYLEDKVITDYPSPHQSLIDEWPQLEVSLSYHQDAGGLNSLGLAFARRLLGNQQWNKKHAEVCFRKATDIYTSKQLPSAWAGTQNNLGIALRELANLAQGQKQHDLLQEAIATYRSALEVYTRKQMPSDWAATQNNLGTALRELANLAQGQKQHDLLQEARATYRSALEVRTREQTPAAWAMTQNNLGTALGELANLAQEQKQHDLLQEAIAAYRSALEVRTREQTPSDWAMTQNNLGTALNKLANLAQGQKQHALLQEARAAYRSALEVYTRKQTPSDWAATQNNLGNALSGLANLAQGQKQHDLLQEARATYRSALEVQTREQTPAAWAMTQNNLGNALSGLANLAQGQKQHALLQEARAAYRSALEVQTREQTPAAWAMTQNNLGITLGELANLAQGQKQHDLLQEAIAAYRSALEVYTREQTPSDWAMTQNNLGITLGELANLAQGQKQHDLLQEARAAHRSTLEVYTCEQTPSAWAATQNNLGNALRELANLAQGQKQHGLLQEAIAAFHSALEVYTRKQTPSDWAMTQNNLGITLGELANLAQGQKQHALLQEARAAYSSALEVYTHEQTPSDWATTQNNLGTTLSGLANLAQGQKQHDLLQEARAAYRSALEVYTHEQTPSDWAMTQNNLGITLGGLANLAQGQRQHDLLQGAIAAFQAALEVRTREHNFSQWVRINRTLIFLHLTVSKITEDLEESNKHIQKSIVLLDSIRNAQQVSPSQELLASIQFLTEILNQVTQVTEEDSESENGEKSS